MPRMTPDLLVKCTGQAKRKRGETQEQYLKRITHLYCSEKGIDTIEGLANCRKLSVLYLYDNFIKSINNLACCVLLTHLYLQNNNITRIAGLSSLHRLSKLYLSGNAITVLEGLEELKQLSELHVAHQRLPEGEKLLFDPRSLSAVGDSLTVFNVSGNNLDTISELRCLTELVYFSACDNMLSNMKDINRAFSHMDKLSRLELSGNPLCHKSKYRDRVITMGSSIVMLDGHEVSEMERQFLMNWKAMRKARRRQQKRSLEQMPYQVNEEALVSPPLYVSGPAPPLTLPALPARQLPHRCKKVMHQEHSFHKNPAQLGFREDIEGGFDDFKLPELIPYHQSIIAQQGHLLSTLSNQQLPKDKLWRTIEVGTGNST